MPVRAKITEAVRAINEKMPKELESYWETIKEALLEVPDEELTKIFGQITQQLQTKNKCFIIREGDKLGVVEKFQIIKLGD